MPDAYPNQKVDLDIRRVTPLLGPQGRWAAPCPVAPVPFPHRAGVTSTGNKAHTLPFHSSGCSGSPQLFKTPGNISRVHQGRWPGHICCSPWS